MNQQRDHSEHDDSMILEYNTSLGCPLSIPEVIIPLHYEMNVSVDWGDGIMESFSGSGWSLRHKYSNHGKYIIKISGKATHFGFSYWPQRDEYGRSTFLLTRVISFGRIGLQKLSYAFSNAENLLEVSDFLPETVTDLSHAFAYNKSFNISIEKWDVSRVTNMEGMFMCTHKFNQPLNQWDVSNVEEMSYLFQGALAFNQPLNSWNFSSKLKSIDGMFNFAVSFNQDISGWDMSNIVFVNDLFNRAKSFNQPIGSWNLSKVRYMDRMLFAAEAFNQPIGEWDVSLVVSMKGMLGHAKSFNQPIGNWNVSLVKDMSHMFMYASSFNQYIGDWNVSYVYKMNRMFYNACKKMEINNYANLHPAWHKRKKNHSLSGLFDQVKYQRAF